MEHARHGYYDVVVANFFLNVFDAELMPSGKTKHFMLQLRDGGTFMIADFRLALRRVGGTAGSSSSTLGVPTRCFCLVANNPFHPIYDYDQHLPDYGLTHPRKHRDFGLFGRGPPGTAPACNQAVVSESA